VGREGAIAAWNHRTPAPTSEPPTPSEIPVVFRTADLPRPKPYIPPEALEASAEPPTLAAAEGPRMVSEAEFNKLTDCGGYYCDDEHGHIDCQPPAPAAEHRDACKLFRIELAEAGRLHTERYNCICDAEFGQKQATPAAGSIRNCRCSVCPCDSQP